MKYDRQDKLIKILLKYFKGIAPLAIYDMVETLWPGRNTDEKVKFDIGDPVAGYLWDKVKAGDNIILSEGTGLDANKVIITGIPDGGILAVETDMTVTGNGLSANPVKLVNDEESPGALQYYGTNAAELKGYHDLQALINDSVPFLKTGWIVNAWEMVTISISGRTVTLTPVDTTFNYWIQGVNYFKTGPQSIEFPDTTGLWFIYYDGETLTASTSAWSILADDKAFVAVIYWNATQSIAVLTGWEFHTFGMGPAEHNLVHTTIGTRYAGGLGVSINGTDIWKINVTEGTIIDEDINAFINAGTEPFMQTLAALAAPKLYRLGAGVWYEENAVPTNIVSLDGSNEVYVNTESGGTWSLVPTIFNKYSAMWLIAFTDWQNPLKWIIGQEAGDTLQDALDFNTLADLDTSGLPGPEFRVIARVIVRNLSVDPWYEIVFIDEMQNDDIIVGGGTSTDSYVTGVSFDSGTRDLTLTRNNALPNLTANIPTGNTDEKVKYDAADPTAGYLSEKIVAGTNVTIAEGTGADENKLVINATGGGGSDVVSGLGMDFVTNDPVDLGLPSTIDSTTENALTAHSHTHKLGNVGIDNIFKYVVNYAALYNWYAAADTRQISSVGWHIPSDAEFTTLQTYLGGYAIAGGKLKDTDLTFWDAPNTGATNEVGFNGRGGGNRSYINGEFSGLKTYLSLRGSDDADPHTVGRLIMFDNDEFYWSTAHKINGVSIRLIKDSTLLSHGETGFYQGNDGKIYRTICIGSQEWMADNLAETKFRNGDWIPGYDGGVYTPISNADWISRGAYEESLMCYYSDNEENASIDIPLSVLLHPPVTIHPDSASRASIDGNQVLTVNSQVNTNYLKDWQGWTFEDVVAGTAKDYVIDLDATVGYTIDSIVLQTDTGTLTGVALKINGTAVTGISAVTITTTKTITAATAANIVTAGDLITFHITTGYTGAPTLVHGKINLTRT